MPSDDREDMMARLRLHTGVAGVPEHELEWLADHGAAVRYPVGHVMVERDHEVLEMHLVLKGSFTFFVDRGGVKQKIAEWRAGAITGMLPFSRMKKSPGDAIVTEPVEGLMVRQSLLPELIRSCPEVTGRCVHIMLDRARMFTTSDLQDEKMASLGKLSAGIAHELNNPASAAARSAKLLHDALVESDEASRALGAVGLSASQRQVLEKLRTGCAAGAAAAGARSNGARTSVASPLMRADREDEIADWLDEHGIGPDAAQSLADTGVELVALEELAAAIGLDALAVAVRWVAAGCAARSLVTDVERASNRVYELVSAVKRFTYMDRATVPEPMDIGAGIYDTAAILASKARAKSITVTIEIPDNLPPVRALGGELNQVWINLIDNALDAAPPSGHVSVRVTREHESVVVRVTDDGHGIPEAIRARVFEPFFTTKSIGQGTGIGLETARKIVNRHEGVIDFDSAPGRTEFRVAFPIVRPSLSTPPR